MTIKEVQDIEWYQSQKLKYQTLCEKEKNLQLKIIYRRMTVFYARKINKIIYGETK